MDTRKQEEPFISSGGVFVATDTAIANFVPDCNENLGISFFRGNALTFKEISTLYEYARNYESRYPGFLVGENPFTEDEFFTELAKRNIELEDAPEAAEQYIILGTDFRRVNWQALIPYWNRAKIYTQNGFLSFLDGERISRDDEDEIDFFWECANGTRKAILNGPIPIFIPLNFSCRKLIPQRMESSVYAVIGSGTAV